MNPVTFLRLAVAGACLIMAVVNLMNWVRKAGAREHLFYPPTVVGALGLRLLKVIANSPREETSGSGRSKASAGRPFLEREYRIGSPSPEFPVGTGITDATGGREPKVRRKDGSEVALAIQQALRNLVFPAVGDRSGRQSKFTVPGCWR